MSNARASLTLALFFGGLVTGIISYRILDTSDQANPYPSLEKSVAEPRVTASVVDAIRNDDSATLSSLMDTETLQKLHDALEPTQVPIADVRSITYKGSVTNSAGRTLAAYVASVRDMSGTDVLVGFVLQVQDDKIVGVN